MDVIKERIDKDMEQAKEWSLELANPEELLQEDMYKKKLTKISMALSDAYIAYASCHTDALKDGENATQHGQLQSAFFNKVDSLFGLICGSLDLSIKKCYEWHLIKVSSIGAVLHKMKDETKGTPEMEEFKFQQNLLHVDTIKKFNFDLIKYLFAYQQELVRLKAVLDHESNRVIQGNLGDKKRTATSAFMY